MTAELVVVGLLLQNPLTQSMLHIPNFKKVYFISLLFSALAVLMSIILRRLSRQLEKTSMGMEQYAVMDKGGITVLNIEMTLKGDFKTKIQNSGKKIIQLSKFVNICLILVEVFIVCSFTIGLVFVYLLIKHS